MKILKFILFSIFNGLAGNSGAAYFVGWKSALVSIISLIILGSIFTFFNIIVFKNKKLGELWAFLCTLGLLGIFCVLCIIFELLFL